MSNNNLRANKPLKRTVNHDGGVSYFQEVTKLSLKYKVLVTSQFSELSLIIKHY